MEGTKIFTCHLEAEVGQFPEYCLQDVCCGVYKQPNRLTSLIWLLLSLIIIALTCVLIYAYANAEEHESGLQPVLRVLGKRKQRLGRKEEVTKPNIPEKVVKKEETEEAEEEEEPEEEEEEEDEEDNEIETSQYSKGKTIEKGLENTTNTGNAVNGNEKSSNQIRDDKTGSTSNKPHKSSPSDEKEETPQNKHNTSPRNLPNGNVKITYIKEEYSFPNVNSQLDNQIEEKDKHDSVEYYNLNYKHLDINTNK